MNVKRWVTLVACLAVSTTGLAACSGDSDGGDDASNYNSLEGDPIVIGTICSCSGVQAAALGKSAEGVKAWTKQINDAGGLNGHPVKLIAKDDGGDPAEALQAAKELVEEEKVIAIVGDMSVADGAFQEYVEGKQIPVVGGLALEKSFLVSPFFFASGSSAVVTTYGIMKEAKAAGASKLGTLYCAESPLCAEVDGLGQAFGQMIGIEWQSGKISATQPNYTAQCLSMKEGGVDALFLAHNATVGVRAASDCTKAGYQPRAVGQLNPVAPQMIASTDFEGALLIGANATHTDDNVPGVKEFLHAVEAYESGLTKDAQFTLPVIQSWAGAKLFEAAATEVKLTPESTSADVLEGLYSLKDETLGGLSAPLNFTKGKPAFPSCYFVATIEDKALVAKQSEPVCLDAEELGAMGQLLQTMAG
ncbi:ABC transporter substrate-binding protein [Nocardioides endophyticus]|uniref:ABC transporter substrate-binding protein n=1 Tax=Nocardioides endophyticus TaxID=1353775 RepID=A0ABP8YH44_9ACTN